MRQPQREFHDFEEFYEYYLDAHRDLRNLRLHFYGTSAAIAAAIYAFNVDPERVWMYVVPVGAVGYLMAWYGHFFLEKNKPATFGNPFWSFRAGLRMYREILSRKIALRVESPRRTPRRSSRRPPEPTPAPPPENTRKFSVVK